VLEFPDYRAVFGEIGLGEILLDAGKRARAIAIWQASCELEIVPSLHSNRGAGTVSATGSGLAGIEPVVAGEAAGEAAVVDSAGTAAGAGVCATSFWKSAQPAHDNVINRARAERTCGASGESPWPTSLASSRPARQRMAAAAYNGEA
jgi:hypothetical protein